MTKKTNHYINNADFLKALIEYKENCDAAVSVGKEEPRIPNYIGECFLKIANHLSRKPNFVSYSFRDEMISDGIENCLMYFRNFDPTKSKNPFAYFTQIIYYAFLRRIMKERKQLYVKYKATEMFGIFGAGETYEDAEGNMKQFVLYENISEFIQTFEESKEKKKKIKENKLLEELDVKALDELGKDLLGPDEV
jgi:predicted RNase H-like HicB family nuclease